MADKNSLKQKILGVWGLICAKLDALRSDLTELRGETQATITANGVLKGDGHGNVSAAVAGTDYLPPSHNASRDAHAELFDSKTTLTPVYSDTPTFTDWVCSPEGTSIHWNSDDNRWTFSYLGDGFDSTATDRLAVEAVSLPGTTPILTATRTRTDIIGYTLGDQDDKPLAPAGDYAKKSDIPAVVAPSTSANAAGKAADAKATGDTLEALQFKEWFPGGEAKSIANCTPDLKFDWAHADETNHTVEVLPFCNTGDSTKDNSDKSGRVVIPPYAEKNGVRYAVVGVAEGEEGGPNETLTAIVAPTTVTSIMGFAFTGCTSLTSVSLPAATEIGWAAFSYCHGLTSVSFPAATSIVNNAFFDCSSLTIVSLPAAMIINDFAFSGCTSLTSMNFGPDARQSVPESNFFTYPDLSQSGHTCRIIVPDDNYDAWTADPDWAELTSMGYEFVKWSSTQPIPRGDVEGVYAKLTDVPTAEQEDAWTHKVWEYANSSAFPVTGTENRVYVDKSTNLTYRWDATSSSYVQIGGSSIDVDDAINATSTNPVQNQVIATALSGKANSAALAAEFSASTAYPANSYVTHDGLMYKCASSVAAGAWNASNWTQVDLMSPDATFDVLADGRLRIADASGNELWSQGYALASSSDSPTTALSCNKVNYYGFVATAYEAFSESSTYSVDAVVVYNGKVYKCTTAVDTAGPWTGSTNWEETPVSETFTLPKAGNGKVGDFILDVSNANNYEVHISLSNYLIDYDIIVPRGESISEILTVPADGLAEFYFTTTAFGTAAKPAWKVVRQLVEKEEAQS